MNRIVAISLLIAIVTHTQSVAQTPVKPRDPSISGPQTFAIILGISKYKYVRPLAYADKDAILFKEFLQSPGGGSVKEENIFSLLNEKATSSSFWSKSFQWLKAKKPAQGDKIFIYLAGHGDAIDEEQFFFLTYDCNPMGDKNNYLAGGSIQLYNLKRKIAAETAKGVQVIFVMDACRTSELPGGQEGQSFLTNAISEQKMGEIMMLATAAGQESLEDASIGNGHGLFTYYLVDGLSGLADSEGAADNEVTYNEIKKYIDKNVPSVAMQQFKKKQEPFFCCNEYSEKVISKVDASYLKKWQQNKKKRGGTSFIGNIHFPVVNAADTLLTETYNRFNKAIQNKKLTGTGSAEDYYNQLQKKFPGNPATEDARTSLAAEFIDFAQGKINDYLSCFESSAKQRQENFEAGMRLQKAIDLLKNDEPEYAKELADQMHLLKAAGDYGATGANGSTADAFKEAYAALKTQPNAAYIQNWLAILHFENNRPDSAKYYAESATRIAPKWRCAFLTLAKLQREPANNNQPEQPPKPAVKNSGIKKFQFGSVLGAGQTKYEITATANPQIDTLTGATANGKIKYDFGVIGQISLGNLISIRPAVLVSVESSEIVYTRRFATGGTAPTVTVPVKTTSVNIPVPIIVRFSNKNITPYISAGPVVSFVMQKDDANSQRLAVKPVDILGDAGLGVDIGFLKSHLVISPELKYTRGFADANETGSNTSFNRLITKMNKQSFTFSIYVRAR